MAELPQVTEEKNFVKKHLNFWKKPEGRMITEALVTEKRMCLLAELVKLLILEKTKVSQDTILVSKDVTSLYTNIPQEEGITTVCKAYEAFHDNKPPIPSYYLKEMLKLILQENSFQFVGKNIPSDPWNCNGYKNGRCICKHLYG